MNGIKSKSEAWSNWIKEVDQILSETQINSPSGNETEYSDQHFQDQMKKLVSCSINFTDMPIYLINSEVACSLLWDEIERKKDERDAQTLNWNNNNNFTNVTTT